MAISDAITAPLTGLGSYAAAYGWGPLLGVSRSTVLSLLSRIRVGQLKIEDVNGKTTVFGEDDVAKEGQRSIYSVPQVELTVHKEIFWVRMLLFADMVGRPRPRTADCRI